MAAAPEKTKRIVAKSNLTRNINKLTKVLDVGASLDLVTEQFHKVRDCYGKLEQAHDDYLLVAEIDISEDPDGIAYMNAPDASYEQVLERYAQYAKVDSEQQVVVRRQLEDEAHHKEKLAREEREQSEKESAEARRMEEAGRQFANDQTQLISCIEAFNKTIVGVRDSIEEISPGDKRNEWSKVESEYSILKQSFTKVLGIDPSFDVALIRQKFEEEAELVFLETRKVILPLLKDSPLTSGGTSSTSSSLVKRESVGLPKFEGDEKSSPFLKFPIWKQQWDVLIKDYEVEFRASVLLKHIDEPAQQKFVGYENKYDEAMSRLVQYYGDPLKVVGCVMEEVNSPSEIPEGDYEGLIMYTDVLRNNYNRLTAMGEGYEHEMSNSTAMTNVLRKFPRTIGERWHEHLSTQSRDLKAKPFPILIQWLQSRKEIWEGMAGVDVGRSKGANVNYLQHDGESSSQQKVCFKCGQKGHVRRDCPKNEKQTDGVQDPQKKKPRNPPKEKKFWCALHKGDQTRRCNSECCKELRRLDVSQRIALLKENKDCFHCGGDHKATVAKLIEFVVGERLIVDARGVTVFTNFSVLRLKFSLFSECKCIQPKGTKLKEWYS